MITDKAKVEITKELAEIALLQSVLVDRYEREMRETGTISKEALSIRKHLDERIERIYK